jgi:hypothetical protein
MPTRGTLQSKFDDSNIAWMSVDALEGLPISTLQYERILAKHRLALNGRHPQFPTDNDIVLAAQMTLKAMMLARLKGEFVPHATEAYYTLMYGLLKARNLLHLLNENEP